MDRASMEGDMISLFLGMDRAASKPEVWSRVQTICTTARSTDPVQKARIQEVVVHATRSPLICFYQYRQITYRFSIT